MPSNHPKFEFKTGSYPVKAIYEKFLRNSHWDSALKKSRFTRQTDVIARQQGCQHTLTIQTKNNFPNLIRLAFDSMQIYANFSTKYSINRIHYQSNYDRQGIIVI